MAIANSPLLLPRASGTSFPSIFLGVVSLSNHAPRDSRSDPTGLRLQEPSGSQNHRGQTPAFMRRRPRWVARWLRPVPLRKPPQPMAYATGVAVPERKIGSEAMEASAKLRNSSIDCLSAASFEAARSEQLRLPAEGPLKRGSTLLTIPSLSGERDGSSRRSTLNPLPPMHLLHHSRCSVGLFRWVREVDATAGFRMRTEGENTP